MITIKQFIVNPVQENCFVVSDASNEAVIIDCGCFSANEWIGIKNYISSNNLKVVALLNTHLHFDHVLGNRFPYEDFGLVAQAHSNDLSLYQNIGTQLSLFFGDMFRGINMPKINTNLKSNDLIAFGTHKLKVIETPGHSRGSVCFYCEEENTLWSGDTLFEGSIGRTDLEGGNYATLIKSITDKLLTLPENTKVYPGHGSYTTIADEKMYNPYL